MAKELQELRSLVARVKSHTDKGVKLNEANTKASLITPLLGWLGWDTLNPDEVYLEWRRKPSDEPADYALLDSAKVLLLIEAKPLHDSLKTDKGWRQLAANGLNAGIRWCARMNGHLVILVNLLHEAPIEKKVFWTIDLARVDEADGIPLDQAADRLKLLSKKALLTGRTDEAWDKWQAQMNLDNAIQELLSRPPDSLIEMVCDKAGDTQLPADIVTGRLRQIAEIAKQELPPLGPAKPRTDPGGAEEESAYWITSVRAEKGLSAIEWVKQLVGEERRWAFGERTPGKDRIKPPDRICFYAKGRGVVAHAVVASKPEKNKKAASPSYPWVFRLRDPVLYLDEPVAIDAGLRSRLDAFKRKESHKSWAWFVQATRNVTGQDFGLLTRQKT